MLVSLDKNGIISQLKRKKDIFLRDSACMIKWYDL